MKKLIFGVLLVGSVMVQSYGFSAPAVNMKDKAEVVLVAPAFPSPDYRSKTISPIHKVEKLSVELAEIQSEEPIIEEVTAESPSHLLSDDIPLDYEEQCLLQDACEEFDVPYALALALIERETNFRNVKGDHGASHGYMQIQPKWNKQRMVDLNVTDLMNPGENFRVGLDILSGNYRKYESWGMALTVYNMGHNPGYISKYAKDVLNKYDKWTETIDTITARSDSQ